ncbi:hypothetical protein ACFXO9_31410 [Nocardia tengchongensis]|uniref:hypothetical protein n=1 Tax=Nocardia tengchongensis TaxID=2055889 RepID=UPI0036A8EB10
MSGERIIKGMSRGFGGVQRRLLYHLLAEEAGVSLIGGFWRQWGRSEDVRIGEN